MNILAPNGSEEGGNTVLPPLRQPAARKRYCFTLNNYSNDEKVNLALEFRQSADGFIIGEEIGENGTPHLQGYVEFKIKKHLRTIKKINDRIHWEGARGDRMSNIKYCSKEKIYISTYAVRRPVKFPDMERRWQKFLLEKIRQEPDGRKIIWCFDREGGQGKSTFSKFLYMNHQALMLPTKQNDAFYVVAKAFNDNHPLNLIVFDIPRSSKEFICYGVMEKVKDGFISSGKYESCSVAYAPPHVLVFSNEPPDRSKMSSDRWEVYELYDFNAIPYGDDVDQANEIRGYESSDSD